MTDTRARSDQHNAALSESQGLDRVHDDLTTRFSTVPQAVVADHIRLGGATRPAG